MTEKRYFGFISYFAALILICAVVWFWVNIWILAVIPHMVFGAFFLSVFADTAYMFLRRNMTTLKLKNAVFFRCGSGKSGVFQFTATPARACGFQSAHAAFRL